MTTVTAFHGTKNTFENFEFGKANLTTYSKGNEAYFTSSEDVAATYGSVKYFTLNFSNPLTVDFSGNNFSNFHIAEGFNELKLSVWKEVFGYHEKYANILLNSEVVSLGDRITLNAIAKYAKIKGFDGVIAKQIVDVAGECSGAECGTNYVVFNEYQISK